MANGNYYLNQGIGTSGIAEVQNPIYAKKEYNPFKGIRAISRNVGQYFTSDSQYDKGLGDIEAAISEGLTVEDLRAENQSTAEMWGNALVNNLVIAGTTAISGTIGLVDGIIEAVGTGETNRLWNNTIDNWAVQQQEAARAAFPIYKGSEYEAKNTWEKLGTGIFWAEAFQNLGFTEGMLIPGMGVSKLISSAPKLARQIIPSFVSSIGEGSIEAINTKNDEVNSKIAMANARYNELANNITDPYQLDILNQDYNETIQAIEEDAKDAGNLVLATNIALLTATNTLEFGKMFSRGFGTSKRIANDMTRKGIKRTSEGLYEGLSMPMEITKAVGKKVLDATAEAGEEVSQEIIGRVPSNLGEYNRFNESQFNPEKRQLATDLMQGFIMSASEAMKDSHTYEAAAMGFVTGLFGVPMLKKRAIPVTIENSLFSEITEARDKVKRSNDIINNVNNRLSEDKKINAYYSGLVRHLSLQDDMNTALDSDDQFNYKNAESAQFISDMMMFDDLGDLNRLSDIINNSIDTSDEGIQALIEETSKDGEGPFMQNGNPIDNDVIRNIIEEKKKILNDKITSYKEAKDNYSKISPLLSEEALKAAIFYSQQMGDYKSRLDELMYTSYNGVRSINNSIEDSDFQLDDERTFRRKILTDSNYKDKILDLFNNEKSTIPYNKKQDIFKSINDAIKLSNSIMTYAESLEKLLKNPEEFNNSIDKSREKVAKVNKASEDIKKKDNIVNKSVSEINKAIDNGEMTEDDLLSIFSEVFPSEEEMSEVESKAKSALDIRDKTSKIKAEIDKSDADEMTKNNAKKLIDNSKVLADSLEDLTDLSSEAFNDPSFMYDELDPSLQGLDREALQDEVEIRLGGTKNLLSEMISIVEDNDGKLDGVPNIIPDSTKESSVESTGHDSVDKNEPINKPKTTKTLKGTLADNLIQQAIDESNNSPIAKTLRDVIKDIDRLVNAGAVEKTIKKTIYNSASYKKVVEGFPGLVQSIDNYISDKLQERDYKSPEVVEERTSKYNPLMEEDILTTENTSTGLQDNDSHKPLDKVESTGGIYTSWLSPLSKYYRYSPKGDRTTFDQVAEGMNYTPEKLKRVKAIWNYLNRHNAFDYVSQGNVKVGDKIEFAISQALNEEAGELVIILRKDDHVVGVLPSSNDKEFNNYAGLSDFVELIKKEYESLGSPISFTSKYTTSVNKNMVGRVPYTSNENGNLNSIFTDQTSNGNVKNVPFELGISSGDGRNAEMIISSVRKGTSRSVKDKQRTIMSPLDAKKGQPYVLIRTSDPNRAYFPVPFSMPYYSQYNSDSALGKAIDNVLNSLVGLQSKDIMKVKREIQELLAIPELHINILKNGNLKIDAKFQGDDKQTNIYNGKTDNPNLVQEVKSKLYGTPFQVSRKYINDTYKGQDYNRMIGELAYTNIDGTHTIDDWFTINPIDKEGNEFKGKYFKSTRTNPNNAKPQVFEYTLHGNTLKVDLNTFLVTDKNNKLVSTKDADIVKSLAYGFKTSKSGIYKTPFGWFNSETLEFVDEPKQENVIKKSFSLEGADANKKDSTPSSSEASNISTTSEQLEDQAKKKGLLGTSKRKELWKALDNSQQETILNTKGLRQKQLMDGLDRAFNVSNKKFDLSKLGGSIENYLGVKPLYRRVTESKEQIRDKEIKWLSKALPNLSEEDRIKVVEGLIKISEEDGGGFAWGQFKQGIIEISNQAARGTVYHEAFHAVTHTLLNDSEYDELFKAGREKYGNLSEVAIEEKLAEDFRRYMQLEEIPFVGRIVKIFRTLKHIVQNLLGKEIYLNKLYFNINKGMFANRKYKYTNPISIERKNILKNSPRDNKGNLLAPNGKPSKLSEEQYITVRTKSFKDWFGDWENNPANASKVIDENGEPLVVYHGSDSKFNTFDLKYFGKTDAGDRGRGFYFSPNKITANSYGEFIEPFFLNIREPYTGNQEQYLNRNISIESLLERRNKNKERNIKNDIRLFKLQRDSGDTSKLFDSLGLNNESSDKDIVDKVTEYYNNIEKSVFAIGNFNTADGYIDRKGNIYDSYEIVIYNPNNAKHAELNTSFSKEDNNFYYRKIELTPNRFQEIIDSVINNATHTIKGRNTAWGNFKRKWEEDGVIIKGYRNKDNKYIVASVKVKEDPEMDKYRRIEQHHREKYMLGNLSNEDKQFLKDKGISIEEYNRMSPFEREVLFHCR